MYAEQSSVEHEPHISILPMSKAQLKLAFTWAKQEDWNPGTIDYEAYFAQSNNGFFMLFHDHNPIGCIAAVKYQLDPINTDQHFGFIGLFIVLEAYRGKGYGTQLFNAALKHLDGIPIGLNSVPQQIKRYAQFDFKPNDSQNYRFNKTAPQARFNCVFPEQPIGSQDSADYIDARNCLGVAHFLNSRFSLFGGISRENLLRTILNHPSVHYTFSYDSEAQIAGFALLRPCENGFRASIYALNFQAAQDMMQDLLEKIPGEFIIFDIPSENSFGRLFAEYFNLDYQPNSDTTPMYKGEFPDTNRDKSYGLLSLEIGG